MNETEVFSTYSKVVGLIICLIFEEKYFVIAHIHQIVSRSFFDVKTISDFLSPVSASSLNGNLFVTKSLFHFVLLTPTAICILSPFFLKMPKDVFPFRNPLKKNCRLQYAMIGKEAHGDEIKRHARATRQNNAFAC